ncbi:MAG: hypothetical protein ACYTCU_03035 [Planctomycetota bacterium]
MIGEVRVTESGHRVEADVDGRPVWFACEQETLSSDAVVPASAFMLPALHARRAMHAEGALWPRWREGMAELQRVLHEWWGYPELAPTSASPDRAAPPPAAGRALLFSGGVDSFYSLLRAETQADRLVFVHGFDVPLADEAHAAVAVAALGEAARSGGASPLVVRTNLREHPALAAVPWERAHGGALAAVGHALADHAGTVHVSATYARDRSPPWGSHWRTDPLWSSERVSVVHTGDECRRAEKLLRIADEPLVQRHLRVCWKSEGGTLNCSRCDKCLLTMLVLDRAGKLGAFEVFEPPRSLARALRALPSTIYVCTVAGLLEQDLPFSLRRALSGLQRRSRTARNPT